MSDHGPQITSTVWASFMERLGVFVSLTSGYHPQANGQVERANQEVGRLICAYYYSKQSDWTKFLLWAEYAQNSLRHSATKLTPLQFMMEYQPPRYPWNVAHSNGLLYIATACYKRGWKTIIHQSELSIQISYVIITNSTYNLLIIFKVRIYLIYIFSIMERILDKLSRIIDAQQSDSLAAHHG